MLRSSLTQTLWIDGYLYNETPNIKTGNYFGVRVSNIHKKTASMIYQVIQHPEKFPTWLTTGRTTIQPINFLFYPKVFSLSPTILLIDLENSLKKIIIRSKIKISNLIFNASKYIQTTKTFSSQVNGEEFGKHHQPT